MTETEHYDEPEGFAFRFTAEGKSTLRSVAIVDAVPVFRFEPSPKVPPLRQEDVCDAFRLALEGKRPAFVYITIPPYHPFYGRQYKQYLPEWIEGRSIGETLAEADWAMKCVSIGTRSDSSKSRFCAWKKTSKLKGLATSIVFPKEKSGGSVIMSCEYVKVITSEDELEFIGEPRLHINQETSPEYTRYINRVLPSVAFHDEPLFLRVQEIIKLILAAEWLVEKGVKISQQWLDESAKSPPNAFACTVEDALTLDQQLSVPESSASSAAGEEVRVPSTDVSIKPGEARHCNPEALKMMEEGSSRISRCGYYDHGSQEMVVFEADGTPCIKVKSLKAFERHFTIIDGKLAEKAAFLVNMPFIDGVITWSPPPQKCMETLKFDNQDTEITTTPCQSQMSTISVVRTTVDDYNMLYKGLDPKLPLRPNVFGVCEAIVPNVQSWNELFSKTVPWPCVWQSPYEGEGVISASGGVMIQNIPVVEVENRTREKLPGKHDESLLITGVQTTQQKAFIREVLDEEFRNVQQYFKGAWHTRVFDTVNNDFPMIKNKFGTINEGSPVVKMIFAVTNPYLEQRRKAYHQQLVQKSLPSNVHTYFHGTSLTCNILDSKKLCSNTGCGICGISKSGVNPTLIGGNISSPRLGDGFYLAPHPCKCDGYTKRSMGHRAMLLCDVLPGKKRTVTQWNVPLLQSEEPYNSVEGVVGNELPEIMLPMPDAIHAMMPHYIIVYTDGTTP